MTLFGHTMAQPSSLTRRATPAENTQIRLNAALQVRFRSVLKTTKSICVCCAQDVEALKSDNARLRKEIETLKTEKDDLLKLSVRDGVNFIH